MDPVLQQILRDWEDYGNRTREQSGLRTMPQILLDAMQKLGLEDTLVTSQILDLWPEVVGSFIASHTQPEALRNHVLTVRVGQPTLRYELERNLRKQIIARLNEALGAIRVRELLFRPG